MRGLQCAPSSSDSLRVYGGGQLLPHAEPWVSKYAIRGSLGASVASYTFSRAGTVCHALCGGVVEVGVTTVVGVVLGVAVGVTRVRVPEVRLGMLVGPQPAASRATRSRASGTAGAGSCPKMFLVACDATCLDAEIVGKVPPPRVAALFAPVRLSPVCSLSVYTHERTKIVPVRWL